MMLTILSISHTTELPSVIVSRTSNGYGPSDHGETLLAG